MMKIKIYTIGRCKESWLTDALSEYEKRLQGRIEIKWLLAKDDAELAKWVLEEPVLIALDVQGELATSEALSAKLFQLGSRLSFVIGGAEGLPPSIKTHARWRWSLSPLTFTHQMTRLILLEQLYRASEIERKSPYHK
ncbi:MAG: 23S rRNA (pseudouridine(1915)-N(3))-methyltransferase RlmH [Chlamydiae bacterium]|nr:23S rRNA (pseudouridine(1915)-N(3))-methyltransferase RlmH [Chlamydiota bacterium]